MTGRVPNAWFAPLPRDEITSIAQKLCSVWGPQLSISDANNIVEQHNITVCSKQRSNKTQFDRYYQTIHNGEQVDFRSRAQVARWLWEKHLAAGKLSVGAIVSELMIYYVSPLHDSVLKGLENG